MESNQVMIDPSILVSAEADKRPPEQVYEDFDYYISDSFAEVVSESAEYADDPTFEFYTGYLDMYQMENYNTLQSTVDTFETFSGTQEEKEYDDAIDYEAVRETFLDRYSDESDGVVGDILYDHVVFLFERSWIASRVKKSQNAVTDVPGLRKFVFERDELDTIANQLPQEYQDKIQMLKGGRKWKWIALGLHVSGTIVSGPLGPAIFTAGFVQDSLGLIFDP